MELPHFAQHVKSELKSDIRAVQHLEQSLIKQAENNQDAPVVYSKKSWIKLVTLPRKVFAEGQDYVVHIFSVAIMINFRLANEFPQNSSIFDGMPEAWFHS